MLLKIYKPGQGYWTRLVSGISGGVFVVLGASYVQGKVNTIGSDYDMYISWGVAVAMLFVLGLLLYWYVAVKPESCDFLIATEGEMRKVNWPTQREVIGSTWIVICTIFFMFLLLFGADALFQWIGGVTGVIPGTAI